MGTVELVWKLYGSRMGHHGNILLRISGREKRQRQKPNYVGGGREAEAESLILWLVECSRLPDGWWLHEAQSLIQGWLGTHFVYLALRTSVLEMGQAVRLGKRNTML